METFETPQPTQPTEPKTTNWSKIVLVAVLGLGLLAAAAYAGYWYGTQEISNLKDQISKPQPKSQNQVSPTPISANEQDELTKARGALSSYLSLLNEGEYSEAVKYHGSGYEILRDWNPTVDPNDYAKLLEQGCLHQLRCLKIREILSGEVVSPGKFLFVVQFTDEDGNLFKRGPCCGATEEEMPTQTEFGFGVEKEGENYLVVTQPVYTP